MKIYFKNTLSGKIDKFKPLKRKHVGMYHCGPTVYNEAHIGNMSAYVFADVLRRLFTEQGYKVNQVINITDVGHLTGDGDDGDDKVEKKAKEEGVKAEDIAEKYTKLFMEDLARLNIDTSLIQFPKATDHIAEQIEIIKKLEEKGYTYVISDGVYFDTSKFKDYGKLGNINVEQLQEGARIEINTEKNNPADFALWKFSGDEKRQQEWDSPWGVGFPGWHIECSAMSRKYLGETFDIHTGGIDHIPTHHNNEIAQSEGAFNHPLARYWMHVNHIMLNGEKISKSTGNVVYVSQFKERNISPLAFRYWMLTSHYSTSSNFTWDSLEASNTAYLKLKRYVSQHESGKVIKKEYKAILKELNHDLGTPEAIALIWELIKRDDLKEEDIVATILKVDEILGLELGKKDEVKIPDEVIKLAQERKVARDEKDYDKADVIRDEISKLGFVIKDEGDGYTIEKK